MAQTQTSSASHSTMTVQGLINYLNQIEDKNQPVIWQFYLAKHFPIPPENREAIFAEVAERVNSYTHTWTNSYWFIDDIVEDVVNGYHQATKHSRNQGK